MRAGTLNKQSSLLGLIITVYLDRDELLAITEPTLLVNMKNCGYAINDPCGQEHSCKSGVSSHSSVPVH